jgi:hypothetical protein
LKIFELLISRKPLWERKLEKCWDSLLSNGPFSSQGHKPPSNSPLFLGHSTVDGNGWEILLH